MRSSVLNPNAKLTPTTLPCGKCGGPIKAFYVVMLCDDCLEDSIPERPCHVCGVMSKHHPRFTRLYDGGWMGENDTVKPGRYFCAEHEDQA